MRLTNKLGLPSSIVNAVVRDYAAAHDLSTRQVAALVAELPGGSNVVNLKDYRK